MTGGAAWSGFDLNNYNGIGVATAQRVPTRVNKTGWIVGVGTEYALLGGWSVKSEWLYANFGTMHYGDEPGIVNGCIAGCVNADVKMYEYIWRVGMNYRFDWAAWQGRRRLSPSTEAWLEDCRRIEPPRLNHGSPTEGGPGGLISAGVIFCGAPGLGCRVDALELLEALWAL